MGLNNGLNNGEEGSNYEPLTDPHVTQITPMTDTAATPSSMEGASAPGTRLSADPMSVIFSFLVPLTRPLSRLYNVDWMCKFGTYLQPHGQVDTYITPPPEARRAIEDGFDVLQERLCYHNGNLHGSSDTWHQDDEGYVHEEYRHGIKHGRRIFERGFINHGVVYGDWVNGWNKAAGRLPASAIPPLGQIPDASWMAQHWRAPHDPQV
jgi:hypothetical protein